MSEACIDSGFVRNVSRVRHFIKIRDIELAGFVPRDDVGTSQEDGFEEFQKLAQYCTTQNCESFPM